MPADFGWFPEAFIKEYCDITGTYTIDQDGQIAIQGDCYIGSIVRDFPFSKLPVKFSSVSGLFSLEFDQTLDDLTGSPTQCSALQVSAPHLVSVKGLPRYAQRIELSNLQDITELTDIYVTDVDEFVVDDCGCLTTLSFHPDSKIQSLYLIESQELRQITLPTTTPVQLLDIRQTNIEILPAQALPQTELQLTGIQEKLRAGEPHYRSCVTTDAAGFRRALQLRLSVEYDGMNFGWLMVADYHRTGDLLTAMQTFERLFGEPFMLEAPAPATVPDIDLAV